MTRFIAAVAAIIAFALLLPIAQNGPSSASNADATDDSTVSRSTRPGLLDPFVGSVSSDADVAAEAVAVTPPPPPPPPPPQAEDVQLTAIWVNDGGVAIDPKSAVDPFAPISSPDVGDHCASSLDASDITEFFSQPVGTFQGADYQRAFRLTDDRVLWTFQDAFVSGTLVHNVGIIQSGRCFTLLNDGAKSWLLGDVTSHMQQWQWILGGGTNSDGTQLHVYVVQMNETGSSYLSRTRSSALRRVVLDASTLEVVEVIDEPILEGDLYGWSVTSDATYTYLYSHCYQQFGYDTMFGFGECVADVKVARVPVGQFDAAREYWGGTDWTGDSTTAAPAVDFSFVGSGNNPAQISYDGTRFVLVQKRDDWWGTTVDFGFADDPQGPFVLVDSIDEPLSCARSECNTYFASWVPWTDSEGNYIWSIGHNRWNGSETVSHLTDYRPTFLTISI